MEWHLIEILLVVTASLLSRGVGFFAAFQGWWWLVVPALVMPCARLLVSSV